MSRKVAYNRHAKCFTRILFEDGRISVCQNRAAPLTALGDDHYGNNDLARLWWTIQKDPVDCLSKSFGLMSA